MMGGKEQLGGLSPGDHAGSSQAHQADRRIAQRRVGHSRAGTKGRDGFGLSKHLAGHCRNVQATSALFACPYWTTIGAEGDAFPPIDTVTGYVPGASDGTTTFSAYNPPNPGVSPLKGTWVAACVPNITTGVGVSAYVPAGAGSPLAGWLLTGPSPLA